MTLPTIAYPQLDTCKVLHIAPLATAEAVNSFGSVFFFGREKAVELLDEANVKLIRTTGRKMAKKRGYMKEKYFEICRFQWYNIISLGTRLEKGICLNTNSSLTI